jgi:TetR/AcrR family transcriptional repressor of nem operon
MARPREFDEEQAIDAAMRAFWAEAGYEATSTQALCDATGLGRSSIYNTFTSKHALFERALERYMTQKTGTAIELLESPLPLTDKLRTLLWQAVEPDPADPAGCLVVNSMVELGPHDPEVAAALARDQSVRLRALRAAIEAGQRAGELDPDRDAQALAQFVVATISGLRVLARGGADRATLAAVATTALTAL